jgi:hypothetical protein
MEQKISTVRKIFEGFIIGAILLVIVQTFLDEYSRFDHWNVKARNILIVSGFLFDLIFSIEFTLRTIWARRGRHTLQYWIHERGWIDFLSSFPLIILDSGPSVYLLFFAHLHQETSALEVINILKVIKAIRVTRILRLIRIIKIFGKIHNAESKMAQHHTAEISTTAVFTIILVLLGFSIYNVTSGMSLTDERVNHYKEEMSFVSALSTRTGIPPRELALDLFAKDGTVLMAYQGEDLFHSRLEPEAFAANYDSEDFSIVKEGRFTLYISHIDINRKIALDHIQSFVIIVAIVLAFMLIYTRHFVQNISDVLHVMDKGFRKKDYNLQVHVKEEYKNHEVFQLARFYNDNYLPAKSRRLQKMEKEAPKTSISMKDVLGFNADDSQ